MINLYKLYKAKHNLSYKIKIFINIFILFSFIFSFQVIKGQLITNDSLQKIPRICNENNNCILLELARTTEELSLGLMFREKLDENAGMLFDYGLPKYVNIWMLNTLIPLDIIFINNGIILKIIEDAQPCKALPCKIYNSEYPVNKVLEINSGKSKKMNLKIGQKLFLEI